MIRTKRTILLAAMACLLMAAMQLRSAPDSELPPVQKVSPPATQAAVPSPGSAQAIYAASCAGCHGVNWEGGPGGSLMTVPLKHGQSSEEIFKSIKAGYPEKSMAAFGATLKDEQIHALVVLVQEKRAAFERKQIVIPKPVDNLAAKSQMHDYKLETFVDGLKEPWSMTFLPDGRALVTEKNGGLRVIDKSGKLQTEPVANVPDRDTETEKQGGLFDIVAHPQFSTNGLVYLSFADKQTSPGGFRVNMTRVIRARFVDNALVEIKDIFLAPFVNYGQNGNYGGRMAFGPDGMLYFSVGDRGQRQNAQAQNVKLVTGKIHRVRDDGTIPDDNPFVNASGAVPSIWAYGTRNPQGLCFDPQTGALWESEHGMRGGDELNVIRKGANYGWPVTTYGVDYGGKTITYTLDGKTAGAVTDAPGIEPPKTYWTPSIAVCGINFYTGDLFPKWKGQLFVTSLAGQELRRVEIVDGRVISQEILFKGLGRLRHVLTGPDGALYVLRSDRISRIIPAN